MQQLDLLSWEPPSELMVADQPKPQPTVNPHAIDWQEGQIAYYRKLMLRFMERGRIDAEIGAIDSQKQAMRRHMISDLHLRCQTCLAKLDQLYGDIK